MQVPLQITFKRVDPSPFIEAAVRRKVEALERTYPRIMSVRVVVELSSRKQRKGNLFHVSLDLKIPGKEFAVRRDPPKRQENENMYVALRHAFDALRRQLEEYASERDRHGKARRHNESAAHGRVARLFPNEGYGFLIGNQDGLEVYFHENSVPNGQFAALAVGDEVRFSEAVGEEGPRATTVERVGDSGRHEVTRGP